MMTTTYFKLDAPQGASSCRRCLIVLEHTAGLDAQLCWLQATVQAREVLQRMPTAEELCPVTAKAAQRLARARRATAARSRASRRVDVGARG